MKLGIFILQYNQTHLTAEMLKVIPEAIVIDNGSSDQFSFKNVIYNGSNLGFTSGFMIAVKKNLKKYDAFWLMNNDIVITRQAVDRVYKLAERTDFFTPSYNCWATEVQNKGTGKLRSTGFMEFCAPVISRKVFEKIGLWDEDYSLGYGVEWDFCYRARQAGFKIQVDDGSEFYHLGHQTSAKLPGELSKHEQTANAEKERVMIKKYGRDWFKILCEGLNMSTDVGRVTIYTTIFGSYANLKPVKPQNIPVDWICVTDQQGDSRGWTVVRPEFPRKDLNPRLRAKYFKMFPWEAGIRGISIYIDGSIEIKSDMFAEHCLRNLRQDILLHKHGFCHNNQEEIRESRKLKKYDGEPLEAQVKSYLRSGFIDGNHYSCGVLVRKDTPTVRMLMSQWWEENIKWSFHDQISLPYVFWKNNFEPSVFKHDIDSEYIDIFWHDNNKKEPVKAPEKKKPVIDEKLISVLMPCRIDDHEILRDAIRSIQRQTYANWELLIVDDGCGYVVKNYLKNISDTRIRVFENEGRGLPAALNTGIKKALGWLIVRMDGDDIAKPELLKCQSEMFVNGVNICGCQIEGFGGGNFTTKHPERVTRKEAKTFQNFWFVNHPGIAYKTEFIKRFMYADFYPEDYELWIRILKTGETIYNNKKSLVRYRVSNKKQPKDYVEKLEKLRKTL